MVILMNSPACLCAKLNWQDHGEKDVGTMAVIEKWPPMEKKPPQIGLLQPPLARALDE